LKQFNLQIKNRRAKRQATDHYFNHSLPIKLNTETVIEKVKRGERQFKKKGLKMSGGCGYAVSIKSENAGVSIQIYGAIRQCGDGDFGRRSGFETFSFDARAVETGGAARREISADRRAGFQLHQFRHHADFRIDAV
jgi:hypothetical protein